MPGTYIELADLRIEPYSLNHDKFDDKFIAGMQELTYQMVNQFCGQDFEKEGTPQAPVTKIVDGTGKNRIFLPKRLLSLTKVVLYGAGQSEYEYDAENFVLAPKYITWVDYPYQTARTVTPDGCFPNGVGNVGVVGVWGWAAVPALIKYLQGRLIKKLVEQRTFAEKFSSESIGDYSYSNKNKDTEITGDLELDTIIRQYRKQIGYGAV